MRWKKKSSSYMVHNYKKLLKCNSIFPYAFVKVKTIFLYHCIPSWLKKKIHTNLSTYSRIKVFFLYNAPHMYIYNLKRQIIRRTIKNSQLCIAKKTTRSKWWSHVNVSITVMIIINSNSSHRHHHNFCFILRSSLSDFGKKEKFINFYWNFSLSRSSWSLSLILVHEIK